MSLAIISIVISLSCFFLLLTLFPQNIRIDERDEGRATLFLAFKSELIDKIAPINKNLKIPRYRLMLKKNFISSGDKYRFDEDQFIALQQVYFLSAFFLFFFFSLSTDFPIFMVVLVSIFSFFLPLFMMRDYVYRRKVGIIRQLPYVMDLLTLSVEAGLDFTGAVHKVVENTKRGPLVEEFSLMLNQLKMGYTREEALKELSSRVNIEMMNNFVNALTQADRLGTPLGKILRVQSSSLRNERTTRAEKLAGEAPVKMLFPLLFLIFPTIFGILFGPILLKMISGGVY